MTNETCTPLQQLDEVAMFTAKGSDGGLQVSWLQTSAIRIANNMISQGVSPSEIPGALTAILDVVKGLVPPAPVLVEPKKKKRRKPGTPGHGWPLGLSRNDYKAWKDHKLASGATEGINPQTMVAEVEAGLWAIGGVGLTAKADAPEDQEQTTEPQPEAEAPKAKTKAKKAPPPPPPAEPGPEAEAEQATEAA